MDLIVYDDDDRRYVPWAVALASVLLVALLTGVLTLLLARQASDPGDQVAVSRLGAPEPATAPSTSPSGTPTAERSPTPSAVPSSVAPAIAGPATRPTPASTCLAALRRADTALARSEAVAKALAAHTAIMNELLGKRISADQALDRALPVLADGATERRLFDEALSDYRGSRERCSA